MAIHLTCPKGHHLTARESNAGKIGKCPVCKAPVTIPTSVSLSESAIMNILGNPDASSRHTMAPRPQQQTFAEPIPGTVSAEAKAKPATKKCPSCDREIDIGYHICPHCHMYLTGLNDF